MPRFLPLQQGTYKFCCEREERALPEAGPFFSSACRRGPAGLEGFRVPRASGQLFHLSIRSTMHGHSDWKSDILSF